LPCSVLEGQSLAKTCSFCPLRFIGSSKQCQSLPRHPGAGAGAAVGGWQSALRAVSGAGQGCVALQGGSLSTASPWPWECPLACAHPGTYSWCCHCPGRARCPCSWAVLLLHRGRDEHGIGHCRERAGMAGMCRWGWQSQDRQAGRAQQPLAQGSHFWVHLPMFQGQGMWGLITGAPPTHTQHPGAVARQWTPGIPLSKPPQA